MVMKYNITRNGELVKSFIEIDDETFNDLGLEEDSEYNYTVEIAGQPESKASVSTKTLISGPPQTTIFCSTRDDIEWKNLPAWGQPDNGSLKIIGSETRGNVPVRYETGEFYEIVDADTKKVVSIPKYETKYETRAVYTYEADFEWNNHSDTTTFITTLPSFVDIIQLKNNIIQDGRYAFLATSISAPAALKNINVSNITSALWMFVDSSVNLDLSHWDTSNITNMDRMFTYAQNFDQDISMWCVEQIASRPDSFDYFAGFQGQTEKLPCWGHCGCPDGRNWPGAPDGSDDLNLPATTIVVSNKTLTWDDLPLITNAHNPNAQPDNGTLVETDNGDGTYTYEADFIWDNGGGQHLDWLVDVLQFKSNQLYTGRYAFQYMPAAELTALPDLDTSNLTDISYMFQETDAFNQSLDNFDTSGVTVMRSVFWRALAFNQPLNDWDTSNVTTMTSMFYTASVFNQPLDNWDTSNVTNMNNMFGAARAFNGSLDNWNTSNVTDMQTMFSSTDNFNQPLDHFDTSNVTTMKSMFREASAFNQDISNWDTSNVENMYYMFWKATNFNQYLNGWCVENVTDHSEFDRLAGFWERYYKLPCWGECDCPPLPATTIIKSSKELTWADLPTKDSDNGSLVETNSGGGTFTYEADFEWDNSGSPKSLYWIVDVLQFKNNQLKNGRHAFRNMPAIELSALPYLDTTNLTDMGFMFYYAENFNQPLDTFETHNVTDMSSMFYSAAKFNGTLGRWNTSNVTDMNSMFAKASKFNQPLDHFDTSSVTDMQSMFWEALVFYQPLNWDTSSVTTMKMMFCGSGFNKFIIFDTSNVTDMDLMFSEATRFDQPINFDTSNVTTMDKMFYFAAGFDRNISDWCVEQIPDKPDNFDTRAGFARKDFKQPQWGQPC